MVAYRRLYIMNRRWWNNYIFCTVANKSEIFQFKKSFSTVVYQGEVLGCSNPPKFKRSSKIVPNSTWLWKLLKIAEFRTPTLKIFGKMAVKF